ncbi:hypothetical protein SAMN02745166_03172 [Prosthecobacter debontii]|uniref:Glycosyl hydrolase family 67 N-terminus n=1 Tax=Prosthecobacter debontii TaxID=48467 RepID=A0A1T4YFK2_9BACT|nr:hypothetical protein [Prosthecobacter debontii]SKB00566.1 hypothetical protein SAMN02745166_03172 [Prosthecobacter debontii]
MTDLLLIDTIGPFFRGYDRRVINWSKIPWDYAGRQGGAWWETVCRELNVIARQAVSWGFNAASIDDVAHLADHAWIEPEVRRRIARYRSEMRNCFQVLARAGLAVHVTMDVFSATPGLLKRLALEQMKVNDYLVGLLDQFLMDFPDVAGVIVRIGESDGKDVHDDFRSQLVIKTPADAREMLQSLLPVFEKHGKRLIFRTWTVGAYPIGDLMWHRDTFAETFKGITSPNLVVSMKYGETDFFRYLPLNRNFFRTPLAKIVELQTRREYEGCGEYPSFVGWLYERYARELKQAQNVIGCMVWCQTGGWVPFRRLAFIDPEALWNDLNTYVTIRVVKEGVLVEDAVRSFAKERRLGDADALLELLRLSDECVRELLYVEEFAQQKLFFRRVRIPPVLTVYWGNIFVSHSIRKLLRYFVRDADGALRSAQRCMDNLARMKGLAERAGVPVADIDYMHDTFQLLALAREYYFADDAVEIEERIAAAKQAYKAKYNKRGLRARYRVKTDFKPLLLNPRHLGWAVQFLMRRQRGYRMVDRLIILSALSLIYRVIAARRPHWIPGFASKSAMGVDVVFR